MRGTRSRLNVQASNYGAVCDPEGTRVAFIQMTHDQLPAVPGPLIDDLAQDAKDFDDWESAVTWAEGVRVELEAGGWLAVVGDSS